MSNITDPNLVKNVGTQVPGTTTMPQTRTRIIGEVENIAGDVLRGRTGTTQTTTGGLTGEMENIAGNYLSGRTANPQTSTGGLTGEMENVAGNYLLGRTGMPQTTTGGLKGEVENIAGNVISDIRNPHQAYSGTSNPPLNQQVGNSGLPVEQSLGQQVIPQGTNVQPVSSTIPSNLQQTQPVGSIQQPFTTNIPGVSKLAPTERSGENIVRDTISAIGGMFQKSEKK